MVAVREATSHFWLLMDQGLFAPVRLSQEKPLPTSYESRSTIHEFLERASAAAAEAAAAESASTPAAPT